MLTLGRQGQLYVIEESTYGTTPALSATNACRHVNFGITYDPFGREPILEKTQGAGHSTTSRRDTRAKAGWNYEGIFRPSGVLNTLPEQAPMLLAAFGQAANITLSTTFSGTPTVSGGTVASATGLAIGQFVLITCPDGKKRLRRLVSGTSGTTLVWAPNLPAGQAPASGAACKGCLTYSLTGALVKSLSFAHYLKLTDGTAGLIRSVRGGPVDMLSIELDANGNPMLKASGPAKDQVTGTPSQPGGFTTVGGNPPSGLSGDLLIDNTALQFLKLTVEIKNAMFVRNEEYGVTGATEAFRAGRREIGLTLDTYHETQAALYDKAIAGTYVSTFMQGGYTEGNCFALHAPNCEYKVADLDDPDSPIKAPYKGVALEIFGQNDELFLGIA